MKFHEVGRHCIRRRCDVSFVEAAQPFLVGATRSRIVWNVCNVPGCRVILRFDGRFVEARTRAPCIYEKETFPRYASGKSFDRGKNAGAESSSMSWCYRNNHIRNMRSPIYSRGHEYRAIDILNRKQISWDYIQKQFGDNSHIIDN